MDPVMIRGSMERVHERGSMDPVYIFMDPAHGLVHGGGPGVHVLYFPAHRAGRTSSLPTLTSFSRENH